MRRFIIYPLALIAFVIAAATVPAAGSDPCADRLCAGAGKVDMTPPVGVPMGGFFSRSVISGADDWTTQAAERGPDPNLYAKSFRQSEGIHTPIHARALVLQAPDGRRFAFASVENRGAPYELHQAVVQRLHDAGADIPAGQLLFSSTHSHAAPSPITPYGGYQLISADLFDPRVFEIAVSSLTEAILQGLERLEPARAGIGVTELLGASRNRSMEPHLRNKDLHPDHDGTATSPYAIDPTVTVVRAEALDGRPIGAFSSFALHGTSIGGGNPYLSGDNMGPSMRFCEQALAARASSDGPAPVCAQGNGAEGDISPVADASSHHVPGDYAEAEQTGRRVAAAVLEAWDAAAISEQPVLDSRFTILVFRGQDGDPGQPTWPVPSVGFGGNFGDGVSLPFSLPGLGNKVPIGAAPGGYPQWVPLQIVQVDGTAMIAVPAEMTAQMSRRVKAAVLEAGDGLFARASIIGLANAYASYVATPEEYEAAYYEGAWTLYGPQMGNLLRNEYARLAAQMAAGERPEEPSAPPLGVLLGGVQDGPIQPDDDFIIGVIRAEPPGAIARGEVVSFSWSGGNPSVDRTRGKTFVRLERRDDDRWVTVATEDDTFSIVRTDRPTSLGPHTWTARFDLPLDLDPGEHRIRVTGRYATIGGSEPYEVTSRTFQIEPSTLLEPVIEIGASWLRIDGAWPAPIGERYATRPRAADGGEAVVQVIRDGVLVEQLVVPLGSQTGSVALEPGDVVRVEAGALLDGHGNSNGARAEATAP